MAQSRFLQLHQDVANRPCSATICPLPKGLSMCPVYFTLIVLMWASCDEGEESHAVKKPAKSFDEQDYREAFMKQGLID
jgi:hypothetical protein